MTLSVNKIRRNVARATSSAPHSKYCVHCWALELQEGALTFVCSCLANRDNKCTCGSAVLHSSVWALQTEKLFGLVCCKTFWSECISWKRSLISTPGQSLCGYALTCACVQVVLRWVEAHLNRFVTCMCVLVLFVSCASLFMCCMHLWSYNLFAALSRSFPEFSWLPWLFQFEVAPYKFWLELSNQRRFVDWLARKLNITSYQNWYAVRTREIVKQVSAQQKSLFVSIFGAIIISKQGGRRLCKMYNASKPKLLQSVVPEFQWQVLPQCIY